jgi:predicted GIY-YIG superfamily endonuclease
VITVYLIECETPDHWYVGVTSDYQKRRAAHAAGTGAAFTRVHGFKASTVIQEVSDMEAAKAAERTVTEALRRGPDLHVAGAGWSQAKSVHALHGPDGRFVPA